MIRVVYRWHVPAENFAEFQRTWSETTHHIHETVEGALGSFMLRSSENDEEILTIAKWDSLESWKDFWGNQNPEQMLAMRKLGKRISAEAFEEIEDFTR